MDIILQPELWASVLMPEGILEKWLVHEGAAVGRGQAVAQVRIEDALHDIVAPAGGRLTILVTVSSVVDPGTTIGQLS